MATCLLSLRTAGAAFGLLLGLAACGPADGPASSGGPVTMRRLTQDQYRQTIADIFGTDIKVAGRFEPDARKDGLLALGTSSVTITSAGFEQYDGIARNIAAQVVAEDHRDKLLPCQPADAKAADEACARQILAKYGRLMFRRPLAAEELSDRVAVAGEAAKTLGDFYAGMQLGLTSLMEAPSFLFRVEKASGEAPNQTLDAYSKAARLSFLLWNTTPDDALLAAAEKGELDTKDGLQRQADRLLASPRLEDGVRAFFADFLNFDGFESLAKDAVIYPKFSQKVAADAREQTLRTIADHLLVQKADYRDLFTTRRTFMNRALGVVYFVPVETRQGWEPYEFAKDDPRAGLLTQLSFTALHSHPGRSSATLRGKAIREVLLCQKVPDPPANVDFNLVQDTKNPLYRTARDRLTAHRSDPTCAGCHQVIDPIGLALENFDGLGQVRSDENGAKIDASGDIDGIKFADAAGLGKALHDSPAASTCLVDSYVRYAIGRKPQDGEKAWVNWLEGRFAKDGYRVPDLLRRIATADAFYKVAPPAAAPAKTASN